VNPVLSVRGLDKRFGAVVAADALSIDIAAGQKVSLIGANGAGKTTFVNMVTGYLKPDSGSIELDGMDIARYSPRHVARLGISRSFQIPQLFIDLTTAENLAVAVSGTRRRRHRAAATRHLNCWHGSASPTRPTVLSRNSPAAYANL
jgi:branched-chain amino acid transport system ATP-binding protein